MRRMKLNAVWECAEYVIFLTDALLRGKGFSPYRTGFYTLPSIWDSLVLHETHPATTEMNPCGSLAKQLILHQLFVLHLFSSLARMPIVLASLSSFFPLCVTQGAACASWRREWGWSQIFSKWPFEVLQTTHFKPMSFKNSDFQRFHAWRLRLWFTEQNILIRIRHR